MKVKIIPWAGIDRRQRGHARAAAVGLPFLGPGVTRLFLAGTSWSRAAPPRRRPRQHEEDRRAVHPQLGALQPWRAATSTISAVAAGSAIICAAGAARVCQNSSTKAATAGRATANVRRLEIAARPRLPRSPNEQGPAEQRRHRQRQRGYADSPAVPVEWLGLAHMVEPQPRSPRAKHLPAAAGSAARPAHGTRPAQAPATAARQPRASSCRASAWRQAEHDRPADRRIAQPHRRQRVAHGLAIGVGGEDQEAEAVVATSAAA